MISVVIPILDVSATIGAVVKLALADPRVSEVIVVDDGSIDDTPKLAEAAGARVITGTLLGKGASMRDGVNAAQNDLLIYLDGDLSGSPKDLIARMAEPLLDGGADFVKASFSSEACHVTTLTARPLLKTFFPELNHIEQPLGGITAARRSLLQRLRVEDDYGADVGLLLDAARLGSRLAQVHVLGQVKETQEAERRMQADLPAILQKIAHAERLALFDMDGVILDGRFIVGLARRTYKTGALSRYLDKATGEATIAQAMTLHPQGCDEHRLCKLNILRHLVGHAGFALKDVVAVGDGENDICLLRAAPLPFAFRPKSESVRAAARHVIEESLSESLRVVSQAETVDRGQVEDILVTA